MWTSVLEAAGRRWRRGAGTVAAGLALLAGSACGPVREVIEGPAPTPHERYAESLRDAGLAERAVGAAWLAEAGRAVREPLPVTLPFGETGFFAGDTAEARGYRIAGVRGQRLVVEVEMVAEPGNTPGLFVDLFELDPRGRDEPNNVQHGDSILSLLTHEVDDDASYVLRLQPELLRPVRYTLTIRVEPTLAFPVDGRDTDAIRSRFGAERDAGRRVHHGVDIFAPRGTPVLAAAAGTARPGTNRLGGVVVWQRVPGLGSLYYAHLDSQAFTETRQVRAGDTVGFVGNSGNAVTTPPHLHFGIYARPGGPVDPFPFLYVPTAAPPPPLEPDVALGARMRTRGGSTLLRAVPAGDGAVLDTLAGGTVGRMVAGTAGWRRLALPDGSAGFVRAAELEPADRPARTLAVEAPSALRLRPDSAAIAVADLGPGDALAVLGTWGDWLLVRAAAREGWFHGG